MAMAITNASPSHGDGDGEFQVAKSRKPRGKTTNKPRISATTGKSSNAATFGSSAWSKPRKSNNPTKMTAKYQPDPDMTEAVHSRANGGLADQDIAVNNDVPKEMIEQIANIVCSEMEKSAATGNPELVWTTTMASMAAVSLVANAVAINHDIADKEDNIDDNPQSKWNSRASPILEASSRATQMDQDDLVTVDDFRARCQQPLAQLLEEFGEEDPSWQLAQPEKTPAQLSNEGCGSTDDPQSIHVDIIESAENRLGRQGKAPLHVEFSSFGYTHGAPPELRHGWSHAQPLPDFECRDLPEVPGYLVWRDGVSGWVQKVLLAEPEVRTLAENLAQRALGAAEEAIVQGGHGYVAPLQMKIYVGSETGRHRSVVVCEHAAKVLRNLLRQNRNPRISTPISVGTHHRDVERAHKKNAQAKNERQKDDFEGDL